MSDSRETLRYLFSKMRSSKGYAIQSVLILILMGVVNLPFPLLSKVTFDILIPSGEWVPIVTIGLLAFGVRAMMSAFQVFQNYLIRRVITGLGHELRSSMIAGLLNAPYEAFAQGKVAELSGRLTSDVDKVEHLIFDGMRFVVQPLSMILLMSGIMLWAHPAMTLLLFMTTPICVYTSRKLERDLKEKEKVVLQTRQHLQSRVSENLNNIRVIRSFSQQGRRRQQVEALIDEYSEASISMAVLGQLMNNIVRAILALPWIVLVCCGTYWVHRGELGVGDLLMFITFAGLMKSSLGQLSYFISKFNADLVAPERVREVSELEREVSGTVQVDAASLRGQLSFDRVSFGYGGGRPVLEAFSLEIPAGKRVALVGGSGAGKSTLMNLLLGFYSIGSGEIRLDGVSMKDLNIETARQSFGMVFQENPLFDGSVRNNLCLGEGFEESELWQALEQAQAKAFVEQLPQGLDTRIGTKGLKLSGGQRQRLAIARVILRRPAVVLMDEATSSLDSATEHQIQGAMETLLKGRTSITIAHRLSTVVNSDLICYLEKGRIVESGNHRELIEKRGHYYRLYQTQMENLIT